MHIRVRFFASLADIVKAKSKDIELRQTTATVGEVFAHFTAQYPNLTKYTQSMMMAINGEFATADSKVKSGDEVAFLPPVSGGLWSN